MSVTIADLHELPDIKQGGDAFEVELSNAPRRICVKTLKVSIKEPLFLGFMHNREDPTPFMETLILEDIEEGTKNYLSSGAFITPTEMTLTRYKRDGSVESIRTAKVRGIAYYLETSGDRSMMVYRAVYALAD